MKELKSPAEATRRPIKMLQFGEGNFLRAFVDWQVDITNELGITDIGIAVVPPRFHANRSIEALRKQDGLYHVILEGIENGQPKRQTRLVSAIERVIVPEEDFQAYLDVVTSPDLRFVVSNTTEAGIRYEKDDARADMPSTFPGKAASLLYRRYQHFHGATERGLIFIPCELIENNGQELKRCVIRQAEDADMEPDFLHWIEQSCIFCDTLVDRIVPGFPKDNIDEIKQELGYDDNMVVKGELYLLWAIGGQGYETLRKELPLDQAGLHVMFMPEIDQFRDKKVRILNGSHTGMVAISLLLGCETVMEAFNNKKINAFVNRMVQDEVIPNIPEDKAEVQEFADGILERFYNPYIRHYLKSIALNSLSKWETRNWCTAKDYYAHNRQHAKHELLTFAALLWLYSPESDFVAEDNPEHVAIISKAWNTDDFDATVCEIVNAGIFKDNFEEAAPGFCHQVADYLRLFKSQGVEAAIDHISK